MGKGMSKVKPKYVQNYNLENRVMNRIDQIEKGEVVNQAPRHPSTVEFYKKIEEKTSTKSDIELNKEVLKSLKTVKVYSKDPENLEPSSQTDEKSFDKRPKKDNEKYNNDGQLVFDAVYEKFGYVNPERLRPGKLTLQQFDQFVNGYKKDKSIDLIKQLSETTKIDVTTLHIFLEHYKAFTKIDGKTPKNKVEPLKLDSVFPNVK